MNDGLVSVGISRDRRSKGQQGAKEKVLHNGQFAQDLAPVHLTQTPMYLGPAVDGTDVIQHGRVPS